MQSAADKVDNVRMRQIASLKQILNLNQPVSPSLAVEPVWKILVLDKYSQDIIAPLLPVKVLRDHGVTLHFLINTQRQTLPDVPAVYLISPTDENVQLLCEDLKKAMYDNFYVNMISPLTRPQLEAIASAAVHSGTMQQVQKLTDQYLNFIAMEDDLFVLRRYSEHNPFTFKAINDPTINDQDMDRLIDGIVSGLFAVCVTMGVVPIIKCPKDNAAELVASKLDQKIRDNLRDARNNLFTQEHIRGGRFSMHRPVLVITDRSIDLATMLHHTWTYQALIHDIMDMDSNRVKLTDSNGRRKEYDMDSTDQLWSTYKGSPFPIVAEAIQKDLEEVKQHEQEIKNLKMSMGMDNESDEALITWGDTTSKLSSAVGNLPELLKRKGFVELHTNIATSILSDIKKRRLDVLFENEEKILNGQTDVKIMNLISECTENDDILRLLMIYYLHSPTITNAEKQEIQAFLQERQLDGVSLRYIERLRSVSNMSRMTEMHHGAGTKTKNMFSDIISNTSKLFTEGVKNLVPKKHNFPLTKMVDRMVDTRPAGINMAGVPITSSTGGGDDEFRYYDPKLMQLPAKDVSRGRGGQLAMDVIVFVIGGGNYVEYQNLVDYAKSKEIQRLTYGCTELVTPKQFAEQLAQLGKQLN